MFPDEISLGAKVGTVMESAPDLTDSGSGIAISFEELFERYSAMVLHLVQRMLVDREEALDVTQEVFLTVYRKMSSFRGESSIKTWIYQIALNRASNRCRWWNRLRRRGTISLDSHLSRDPEGERSIAGTFRSDERSPEEHLLALEERERIERFLLRLPVHQRSAIIMRDIEGMSYEEIAAAQRVSCGTVKSRLSRGRAELKRFFNGNLG